MRVLLAGKEPLERVELLLQLTKISSESIKDALIDNLVRGYSEQNAYNLNAVAHSNFIRALKTLNEVALIVEQIKEIDWQNYQISDTYK